jgi:hypothetical protein
LVDEGKKWLPDPIRAELLYVLNNAKRKFHAAKSLEAKHNPEAMFAIVDDEIGKDVNGHQIWNRSGRGEEKRLFADDLRGWRGRRATTYAVSRAYQEFDPAKINHPEELVGLIGGKKEFFGQGKVLFDLGCGGGQADEDWARKYKHLAITAVDWEMGGKMPMRRTKLPNLKYVSADWTRMESVGDHTVDRIISDQGILLYGDFDENVRELSRIAAKGAIMRASLASSIRLGPNSVIQKLADAGWDVYLHDGNQCVAVYRGE